jgi:branched-chain amino acid transport system ATP-binding protein
MGQELLSVHQLAVSYGRVDAVLGIDLTVAAGKIVTLIGPNGAGKTTTLSALMGLLPARGRIVFEGEELRRPHVEGRVARGIGLVPEKRELFGSMSIEDNLLLGAFMRRRAGHRDHMRTLGEVYAMFPRLEQRRRQAAATLSGGERQMLALGRALMGKPRLLMLDEPSLGLAPLIVREVFRVISQLRALGVAILLVEQNARAALQVADYAYVLENGGIRMHGSADELRDDPRVIESYLGLASRHQDMLAS